MTLVTVRAHIDALYDEYDKTDVLQPLARTRPMVRGCGPLNAPLVIVGEAPGEEEERQGEPFVGRSGQLLRKLLKDAGVKWGMCYVTNTLPWRPPANRTPYPFEIMASMSRVQREVAAVGPLAVIAAGAVAFQALTSKNHGPASARRAKWMTWSPEGNAGFTADLLTIWHPSAILQAPANRRGEMEDETRAALASILEGERAR